MCAVLISSMEKTAAPVCWLSHYARCPPWTSSILITMATVLLAASLNGDWLQVAVHLWKQNELLPFKRVRPISFHHWKHCSDYFTNFWYFWFAANAVAYALYYGIGGFLHWHFYMCRRTKAEEWKCQPMRWLPWQLQVDAILAGSVSLLIANTMSAALSTYISNGGYSTIYYTFDEYGWTWLALQWPCIFLYQDYVTYWLHRLYHTPWMYRHFHKLHHKFKQPTAFTVTAIHPVEMTHIQLTLCLPLFLVPVHWLPFYTIAIYSYYNGILNHSGIDIKAQWWQPWQPDTMFHDNHHQYYHVNFGFNCTIWDKLHGSYRRNDHIYNEDTYGGKPLSEATPEELEKELQERNEENMKGYRDQHYYDLSQLDTSRIANSFG